MKLWQYVMCTVVLSCISCPPAFGNGCPGLELGCNEEFKLGEGPECKIEVKCYHEDIGGSMCWEEGWTPEAGPAYFAQYYFDYTYEVYLGTATIPVCGGIVGAPIGFAPNTKYHCTENVKGKNSEGDVAVEIEIKLGGCFPD